MVRYQNDKPEGSEEAPIQLTLFDDINIKIRKYNMLKLGNKIC